MDELENDVRGKDSNLASNQFHPLSDDAHRPLENDSSSGIPPEHDPPANISVAAAMTCQRCGKSVPGDLAKCPFCAARLSRPAAPHEKAPALQTAPTHPSNSADPDETTALITRLLLFYLVLLVTNLIGHWIAFTIFDARLSEKSLVNLDIVFTAFFESVDTVIVLIAFFKIPVERLPGPHGLMRQLGWLAGPFILAICLGLNFGYHLLLQDYLQFPTWARHHLHLPVQWAILFVCVQPGIVEELFFRYVAARDPQPSHGTDRRRLRDVGDVRHGA